LDSLDYLNIEELQHAINVLKIIDATKLGEAIEIIKQFLKNME